MNLKNQLQELTEKELNRIEIQAAGNILIQYVYEYKAEVMIEIAEPISVWIDDPDFAKSLEGTAAPVIDWAKLKQDQRTWSKIQRAIQSEKQKLILAKIREKERMRSQYSSLLGQGRESEVKSDTSAMATNYLSSILSILSPKGKEQVDRDREFDKIRDSPLRNQLPYDVMLTDYLSSNQETNFRDLPTYYPSNPAMDTVCKLQTLLDISNLNPDVQIRQNEPFADIQIFTSTSFGFSAKGSFILTDKSGQEQEIDWQDLSDDQRNRIITEITENKKICRCA